MFLSPLCFRGGMCESAVRLCVCVCTSVTWAYVGLCARVDVSEWSGVSECVYRCRQFSRMLRVMCNNMRTWDVSRDVLRTAVCRLLHSRFLCVLNYIECCFISRRNERAKKTTQQLSVYEFDNGFGVCTPLSRNLWIIIVLADTEIKKKPKIKEI